MNELTRNEIVRRFRAGAADVADREPPAVLPGRENVVEVAADLQSLARGHVRRGQVEPGNIGQPGRKQAALQRFGDRGTVPEHAVHPDGDPEVLTEFFGEAKFGDLEAALEAAKGASRTTVIAIETHPLITTEAGGYWWDVVVPEASSRPEVAKAREEYEAFRRLQRVFD